MSIQTKTVKEQKQESKTNKFRYLYYLSRSELFISASLIGSI